VDQKADIGHGRLCLLPDTVEQGLWLRRDRPPRVMAGKKTDLMNMIEPAIKAMAAHFCMVTLSKFFDKGEWKMSDLSIKTNESSVSKIGWGILLFVTH
jgi:hypothetical protein